jgi:hypothetical protein
MIGLRSFGLHRFDIMKWPITKPYSCDNYKLNINNKDLSIESVFDWVGWE